MTGEKFLYKKFCLLDWKLLPIFAIGTLIDCFGIILLFF
ncbi:MAG: hypothetical protein US04_C0001G0310 [Candidatus Nomurabacteria bacterium GW2011_GWD2_36_14]|nr:MAG: hypothetical protein US04_C0001G0310 [Candidatus Nomurabacteria bacterium GW2011_GWD2_36_14]KKP99589.1 MAG: hypothetical protein US08_C0001G0271 [Candidatus Nomurabacteria bacterium GW2011_GWF2_36_19]KKQ19403.1 MAG: hypothetical protein US34_C0022G0008 [Candidatus Nomurabacteria bacterium GW2011_GWC2_36_9]KKQ45320.1 MAG: hypothetical protein US64_C0001G0013 [Candidatus Nomurabacteria bacterium GW2011_GWC1_37_9]